MGQNKQKKWIILGIVSVLCVILLADRLLRVMLGEIDKYKAGKNVIGVSNEQCQMKYEKTEPKR